MCTHRSDAPDFHSLGLCSLGFADFEALGVKVELAALGDSRGREGVRAVGSFGAGGRLKRDMRFERSLTEDELDDW